MTGAQPLSHPIERAAPTDIAALKNCELQYAFRYSADHKGPTLPPPPPARLGAMAHRALESLVAKESLFDADLESAIKAAWSAALERDQEQMAKAEGAQADWGPPESWNNYYLIRAQLSVAAGRLRAVLEPVATGAKYLVETPLADPDTVLWGIPDLVVRSPELHALIDYKTGSVRGPDMEVRESYEMQMHIYAYLEFKSSGVWPERSLILSFQDGAVEIETGRSVSMPYVEDALRRITTYSDRAPNTPPANPSSVACRFCRYVPRCRPFWQATPEIASEGLVAVRGPITRISSTPLGGYSIRIQPVDDGPFHNELTIRRIDPTAHHVVDNLDVGNFICATHLYEVADEEVDRSEWRLGRFGELSLIRD